MGSIYHDLTMMKVLAVDYAKKHGCNYNVIISNCNAEGEFDFACGSTYEMVRDSYFEKERKNVTLLHKTDDLIKDGFDGLLD